MTHKRRFVHTAFLFAAPVIVAWLGLGVPGAIALVILLLLWRWGITLSGILVPEKSPPLVLDTISASHFVEKVRWCMDRLDIEYVEKPSGGTLGAFFLGRTVPQLRIRTGLVQSVIGNSPEILRYLWGAYAGKKGVAADFLEPTEERLTLEGRLDRYGVNLQVWVYHHLLPDRQLTLHVWGVDNSEIPAWQRQALRILYPLLQALIRRSFSITEGNVRKAVGHIEALLAEIDNRLTDGRRSILGGDSVNYTDIQFAALSGLWLQPENYGRGKAATVRIEVGAQPAAMREDIERWTEAYPRATAFVERLYREER